MNDQRITLHDKTFRPYIPQADLEKSIDRIAEKLNADFTSEDGGTPPLLLCVLNGAILFTAELMKRLRFNLEIASIKLSSYEGVQSTGHVRTLMDVTAEVKGRRVIIVEDIVDTGTTVEALKQYLAEKGAASSVVCTMLFKEAAFRRTNGPEAPAPEYSAITIEDKFILGFGLDYDELGRNLPDIWILDE